MTMLIQPLNGLGESDAVSQTEYDVTAYRNVMNQLKTISGTLDELKKALRMQLAVSMVYEAQSGRAVSSKLSGFMIEHKGLKKNKADPKQWSITVRKEIGAPKILGLTHQAMHMGMAHFINKHSRYDVADDYGLINPLYGRGGSRSFHPDEWPDIQPQIKSKTYDLHNLMRNLNWEMNRLRIEMPFDLRQYTNQLNGYATEISQANPYIPAFKLWEAVKKLKNSIIPKMEKRLKEKIAQAKLTEKVSADEIRKENEKTLTTAERVEKENNEAMKRIEGKGIAARKSGDKFMLSFNDGESWTKISREQLLSISRLPKNLIRQKAEQDQQPQQSQQESGDVQQPSSGGGGITEADINLRDWAHEYEKQYQQQTQKENDATVDKAAEKEGDTTGTQNGAVAATAGLALLLALGQG